MTISKETLKKSISFGRLAQAAYLTSVSKIATQPGLSKFREGARLVDHHTDTQGVCGRWNNDIVIAFRGTEAKASDWIGTNAKVGLVNNRRGDGRLHTEFQKSANAVFQQLKAYIETHRVDNSRLFLCGHSLGGGLAMIAASWLDVDSRMPSIAEVYTYGAPRVGNPVFAKYFQDLGLATKTVNWTAQNDPVPRVPPCDIGYRHPTKLQYVLNDATVVRQSLDAKKQTNQYESLLVAALPTTRQLFWIARKLDDVVGLDTKEHSIRDSYLRLLRKTLRG